MTTISERQRAHFNIYKNPQGGDSEGSCGDSQSTLHCRHHLPPIPPQIPGVSWYGDRHP